MGIPIPWSHWNQWAIVKIWQLWDNLLFIMGISIMVSQQLYIETVPSVLAMELSQFCTKPSISIDRDDLWDIPLRPCICYEMQGQQGRWLYWVSDQKVFKDSWLGGKWHRAIGPIFSSNFEKHLKTMKYIYIFMTHIYIYIAPLYWENSTLNIILCRWFQH